MYRQLEHRWIHLQFCLPVWHPHPPHPYTQKKKERKKNTHTTKNRQDWSSKMSLNLALRTGAGGIKHKLWKYLLLLDAWRLCTCVQRFMWKRGGVLLVKRSKVPIRCFGGNSTSMGKKVIPTRLSNQIICNQILDVKGTWKLMSHKFPRGG